MTATSHMSNTMKRAYREFTKSLNVVMRDDPVSQLSVRHEVRKTVREQLPVMGEAPLVSELLGVADSMKTSVVQARWNEDTASHRIEVRPEMLSKDGSLTQLNFMTPEELLSDMEGKGHKSGGCCGGG